jgi:SAM-dependent methyltransferase
MASSTARADRDVYRLAPTMEASALEMMAARLEFRGTDEGYTRVSQAYFSRLPLTSAQRVLAIGCGTGIEVRALKKLVAPDAALVGVDHSPTLLDTARKLTADEGLSDNVSYRTAMRTICRARRVSSTSLYFTRSSATSRTLCRYWARQDGLSAPEARSPFSTATTLQ